MTNEEMVSRIDNLYENPEFCEKVKKCKTEQEIMNLFSSEGIQITKEDFNIAAKYDEGAELNAEDLDGVAGGLGPLGWVVLGVGAYCVYKFVRGYIDGGMSGWKNSCR